MECETDYCETCFANGRLSSLIEYNIDFEKTMKLCEKEDCIYPLKALNDLESPQLSIPAAYHNSAGFDSSLIDLNLKIPQSSEVKDHVSSDMFDFDLEFLGIDKSTDTISLEITNSASMPLNDINLQSAEAKDNVNNNEFRMGQNLFSADSDETFSFSKFNSQATKPNDSQFPSTITVGDELSGKATVGLTSDKEQCHSSGSCAENNQLNSSGFDSGTSVGSESIQDKNKSFHNGKNSSSSGYSSSNVSLSCGENEFSRNTVKRNFRSANYPCNQSNYLDVISAAIKRTAEKKLKSKTQVYEGLDLNSLASNCKPNKTSKRCNLTRKKPNRRQVSISTEDCSSAS